MNNSKKNCNNNLPFNSIFFSISTSEYFEAQNRPIFIGISGDLL